MKMFGNNCKEEEINDGAIVPSRFNEETKDIEPLFGLHNIEGDDFDYEGVKYFKDEE